ncbi:MAG: hypothetical protein WKG01_35805 [Kofleriaceae bacterium]
MSPRVAARMAAVCTLLIGVVIARAQPVLKRPVAVIDLSGEPEGEKLAKKLGLALLDHPALSPVPDPALPGELMGAFVDEDADRVSRTRTDKQSAEDRLAAYQFASAASTARDAQDTLLRAHPSPSVIKLYGELAFVLGQARLGERKPSEAAAAFLLAHHLMPAFAPDPARYVPEVLQAFEGAKSAARDLAKLVIRGSGRTWVDGREVGIASAASNPSVELAVGMHVVWMTGPGRRPEGTVVRVRAGENSINITDAPADDRLKVRRARATLRAAPDSTARAAAMKQLAQLLGVRDAILLTSANGLLAFQTWRDQAPGFSIVRQLKAQRPINILEQLEPPPEADEVNEEPTFEIPITPLVWHERPGVRVGIIVGVVSAVVGTVLLVRSIDRTVGVDPPMWPQAGTP